MKKVVFKYFMISFILLFGKVIYEYGENINNFNEIYEISETDDEKFIQLNSQILQTTKYVVIFNSFNIKYILFKKPFKPPA
jgi:hypothetical protein